MTNTNWSTEEFFKLNEAKNKKIKSLLTIIMNILNVERWKAPEETFKTICASCLLPLIENAFRCTSLLDMAKEKDLYGLYLNICKSIAQIDGLLPTLLPLDSHYQPKQITSIEELLRQLGSSSSTFKQLTATEVKEGKVDENTKVAFELADEIIKTQESV